VINERLSSGSSSDLVGGGTKVIMASAQMSKIWRAQKKTRKGWTVAAGAKSGWASTTYSVNGNCNLSRSGAHAHLSIVGENVSTIEIMASAAWHPALISILASQRRHRIASRRAKLRRQRARAALSFARWHLSGDVIARQRGTYLRVSKNIAFWCAWFCSACALAFLSHLSAPSFGLMGVS